MFQMNINECIIMLAISEIEKGIDMKEPKQSEQVLDKLPFSKWHLENFFLLGFGLQINGVLNSSGNSILADLIHKGWSNNYLNAAFSSAMMIGFFIGSLIGGWLGDKIGRKKSNEISILTFAVFSLVAALVPNMFMLIISRGLMGVGMGAGIELGYGSFTELLPAKFRGKWQAMLSCFGNFSPLIASLLCLIAIPTIGWRSVFIICSVSAFVILFFFHKFFKESPHWLLQNGHEKEGECLLNEIVKRVEKEQGHNIDISVNENNNRKLNSSQKVKIPFKNFFFGALGRRTLICSTTLIAMNLALYTINNWIPTIFVNNGITVTKSLLMTTIMIVAAPLGTYFSTFIIEFLPRKLFGGIFIIAIAILGYIYAQQRSEASILIIGFIMIFILYIYNSFSSAVYATELWPTQVKMRGLGISNAIGRFVAITSPYLIAWILTDFGVVAVFITLGILLGLCALIIILFGIETRKKTINEIDNSINLESNREVNHA